MQQVFLAKATDWQAVRLLETRVPDGLLLPCHLRSLVAVNAAAGWQHRGAAQDNPPPWDPSKWRGETGATGEALTLHGIASSNRATMLDGTLNSVCSPFASRRPPKSTAMTSPLWSKIGLPLAPVAP